MRFILAAATVLVSLIATNHAYAAPVADGAVANSFEIRATGGLGGSVTRIGAFRPRRDPSIRAAQRVFGRPSSRELSRYETCDVEWRRLRLKITFANFGGHGPGETTCTSTVGKAQSVVMRGHRFTTWRDLRVGDPSDELEERHPDGEFREGKWWLAFAVSPYGDESEYPSLYATVANGRVNALKGWIGAAGE